MFQVSAKQIRKQILFDGVILYIGSTWASEKRFKGERQVFHTALRDSSKGKVKKFLMQPRVPGLFLSAAELLAEACSPRWESRVN